VAITERAVASAEYPRTDSYAEVEGNDTVVWLTGEHDLASLDGLSRLLAEAIALTRSAVIVDLSGVEFMGATTVGALMRARHFLEARSRRLVLRAPSVRAKRTLDLCRIALATSDSPLHAVQST
jgi:anti-anti-sigma factor